MRTTEGRRLRGDQRAAGGRLCDLPRRSHARQTDRGGAAATRPDEAIVNARHKRGEPHMKLFSDGRSFIPDTITVPQRTYFPERREPTPEERVAIDKADDLDTNGICREWKWTPEDLSYALHTPRWPQPKRVILREVPGGHRQIAVYSRRSLRDWLAEMQAFAAKLPKTVR